MRSKIYVKRVTIDFTVFAFFKAESPVQIYYVSLSDQYTHATLMLVCRRRHSSAITTFVESANYVLLFVKREIQECY